GSWTAAKVCRSPQEPREALPFPLPRGSGTSKTRDNRVEGGRAAGSRSSEYDLRGGGSDPERPRGGKELPGRRTVRGNDHGDTKLQYGLNETGTDSRAGEADAGQGTNIAGASHRLGVDARGVSTHAQGRSTRGRRHDGARVRAAAGRKPTGAAEPGEVRRAIPGATGQACVHPERKRG